MQTHAHSLHPSRGLRGVLESKNASKGDISLLLGLEQRHLYGLILILPSRQSQAGWVRFNLIFLWTWEEFFVHALFLLYVCLTVFCPIGEDNGTPLQYSCLENPMDQGAWWAAVHGVSKSRTRLSDFTFTFHSHALEKEMATHSSVLAWRIPGTGEPGGLPSMGSHRVGHDWSDLAAAAANSKICVSCASNWLCNVSLHWQFYFLASFQTY